MIGYLVIENNTKLPFWKPTPLFKVCDSHIPDSWVFMYFPEKEHHLEFLEGYPELVYNKQHFEGLNKLSSKHLKTFEQELPGCTINKSVQNILIMQPTQFEIIQRYLNKGVEISAKYKRNENPDIIVDGFINCISRNGKYYCLIREIRSDNHRDYFEDNFFDKNEETVFEKAEELIEFVKINTGLNLDDFSKAKSNMRYRY